MSHRLTCEADLNRVYPNGSEYALLLFASHSWAHGHHRDGLHSLLSPTWLKGVDYHDLSASEEHPLHYGNDHDRLVSMLAHRIQRCDAVLILAGMYSSYSYWIEVEAKLARHFDKPILAIAPRGQRKLSSVATMASPYEPIRWRGESVRDAILSVIDPNVRLCFSRAKELRAAAARELLAKAMLPPPFGSNRPANAFLSGLTDRLPDNPSNRGFLRNLV